MLNWRGAWRRILKTMRPSHALGVAPLPVLSLPGCSQHQSPYQHFSSRSWAQLGKGTPLPLSEEELAQLRGLGEPISLDEVAQIYLPLSRLLNLHVHAAQNLYHAANDFLTRRQHKVPYIIGLAGSVAVGKSTTGRVLRTLLARWPDHPKVALLATDGFLYPGKILEKRGLMQRKGFPASYDRKKLIRFLARLKAGAAQVSAPVYSHIAYDIVAGEKNIIRRPDILILEGLNVLQPPPELGEMSDNSPDAAPLAVSDFFDFSIYLDADAKVIRQWYLERFLTLRRTAFRAPESYFHRYAGLSRREALKIAEDFWQSINLPNLKQNILPTRARADLILRKRANHSIRDIWLRKL